jgi:hypothetical protein
VSDCSDKLYRLQMAGTSWLDSCLRSHEGMGSDMQDLVGDGARTDRTSETVTSSQDEIEAIDERSCLSGSGAEAVDVWMPATFERKDVAKLLAENLPVVEWCRGCKNSLAVLYKPHASLR